MALTAGKLREILKSVSVGDDMPVLIRRYELGQMVADDVNDIGVIECGRQQWSNLIAPGLPIVQALPCLVLSTLEPYRHNWEGNPQ